MRYYQRAFKLQGIDIVLPKPGYVFDRLSGKVVKAGIFRRSRIDANQYWVPLIDYIDENDIKTINNEWFRRLNGFWFMNNGKPEYITGLHYYYLNYYYIGNTANEGFPEFWDSDKKFFYFLQAAVQDQRSCGVILVTKRRSGKTQKSGAFLLDGTTRKSNTHGGIQSKTDEDAKTTVFIRSVLKAFHYLPDFFKPAYDKKVSRSALRFEDVSNPSESLNSSITYKPSGVYAYDGQALGFYVGDEVFKTPVNIIDRHEVVKYCLTDTNGRFSGKAMYTSTVEDIESNPEFLDMYKEFWAKSNPDVRNEHTGRTETGLYRYFQPADDLRDRDKYGYCDRERNKEFILSSRPDKGSRTYYSAVRKEPLDMEEAFSSAARTCLWDASAIGHQIDFLSFQNDKAMYDVGNLVWADGVEFGDVKFISNENGRFLIHKHPNRDVPSVIRKGAYSYPANTHLYAMGLDPYDYSVTEVGKGSKGAFYVKAKADLANADYSDRPVLEYINRPPVEVFYDDVIKTMFYYGVPVLCESNKIGFIKHCESINLNAFLVQQPDKKKPGIYSSAIAKQQAAQLNEIFIDRHIEKVVYLRLLKGFLSFDINKTEKRDEVMAWLWTLLSEHITSAGYAKYSKQRRIDLGAIF